MTVIFNQSTNWYKAQGSIGWTANPEYAREGEVDERGLHDCTVRGCSPRHGASAEEFLTNAIRSADTPE